MTTNNLISPLASVHPNAKIGANVEIRPFALVEDNVEIGEGTVILSGAVICSGARIGKNCTIHTGAVIAGIPQDLKFVGEDSLAVIGDGTQVRECVTVNRGTASKEVTIVGKNCLLMAYSHVAHDCSLGNNVIIGNATQLAGEVHVQDYAIVSGGTLVHQFVRIGAHVMVQGGSRITKDVPPYILVGREPLCYCGINNIGLRRRGFDNETLYKINDMYRIIYQRGLNNTTALRTVEEEIDDCPERDIVLSFIRDSQRGIIKGNLD